MKKKITRVLSLTIALMMVICLSIPAAYAAWNRIQDLAHANANNYRAMGFSDTSAPIAVNNDIWFWGGGQGTLSGSYYYSASTNITYMMDGTTYPGNYFAQSSSSNLTGYSVLNNGKGYIANDGNYVFADGSYYDGQYIWHWSNSNSRYYRLTDESARTWGSRTRYNTSGGGNGNQQGNQGNNNYCGTTGNYSSYYYNNKQLYSGRIITGVESYASKSDAELLARLILSYTAGKDLQTKSAAGWMFLNSKGNSNLSAILPYYPAYVSDISLTTSEGKEAVNLAYDLFFRLSAENAGNTYVGRTLPKGYVYYLIDGSGNIYFRNTSDGANYSFPASGTWSQYHNPY